MITNSTFSLSPKFGLQLLVGALLLLIASLLVWPQFDVTVSGWFYEPGHGFPYARNVFFLAMEVLAYYGSRLLGLTLIVLTLTAWLRHKTVAGIDSKGWGFLLLALLVGPCLIANVGFKDHWGRARPREIVEFGGTKNFSPALEPQAISYRNGSFISGDASFGFYLPTFAYVVARRASQRKLKKNYARRFFWGGMVAGAVFGASRLAMGAHFLNDVLCAMSFMLASSAAIHTTMFGRRETAICWRDWFFHSDQRPR